ncbi:MAG: M56 family metallopeptidase, partial [Dokdonella sp.]
RRFRFVRRIRVLVSEHIDTPTLIGWLKPVILLPTAVALGFPRQQVELILAHELGHLRRYDHVVNLAQALLETLFFYHPVVHWISNEVRNEREICCDALVLRVTDGEPCEYARTLAALEELRHEPAARFALAASGGVLLERVRRIVGMPATGLATVRPNFGMWVLTMAGLTVAFAAVLKVDRSVQELELSSLSIDWLPARSLQALPLLALGVQQHRPRLELAAIVAPPPILAISVTPASTAVATGPATPVGAGMPASDHMSRPAVTLPSAIPGQAPEPSADALASASAPAPDSQVEPARVSTVAASVRPTAIRVVTPAYPRSIRSTGRERVEVGFAINGDGSVRDITVADNGFDAGYGRAATSALRQWRFDPATVPGDHAARYTQTFVFAQGAGRGSDSRADEECVQSVGSHICRRPDEGR